MNRRLRWGLWLLVSAVLAALAGCSTEPSPPIATDDDLGPEWARDRALIAYLHISRTVGGSQETGLYVVDTLTHVSQLVLPGIVNGYDWIPGTDTLVVSVGGAISLVARSGGL